VIGGTYYALLGEQLAEARDAAAPEEQPAWTMAIELLRCLVIAVVVAALASWGQFNDVAAGLLLGIVLWIGFPFVLWTGAVVHEGTPLKLAAIHAGDWLLKLLAVATIVGVWQ
jgi:hypothetical protein